MTARTIARLQDVATVLVEAGYAIEQRPIGHEQTPALLAETPEALVAVVEVKAHGDLADVADQAQAALTHLAGSVPSPRMWDLYVVLHVLDQPVHDDDFDRAVERLESDTAFSRKLVRVAVDRGDLDHALRPLLPMHAVPTFDTERPLDLLLNELLTLGVQRDTAKAAIKSFETDEEMVLP